MRTEWIVILTIYSIALPILTGLAALRVTRETIESETLASLSSVSIAFKEASDTAVQHQQEHLVALLKLIDTGCGTGGALNEDCAQAELRSLIDDGANSAVLRYKRSRNIRSIMVGRRHATCTQTPCIWRDSRSGQLSFELEQRNDESAMSLSVSWPLMTLLHTNLQSGDSAAIVRTDGAWEVVGRSDVRAMVPESDLLECTTAQRSSTVADKNSYRALVPLSSLRGVCGVTVVRAESVLQQGRVKSALARVVMVFVVASLVLAFLISLSSTRALRELRDRMRNLKVSDSLPVQAKPRGPAEIRELSTTFENMVQSLRRSQQALTESERKLSMAYQAANIWVWEHNIETGQIVVRVPAKDRTTTTSTLRGVLREVHPDDRHKVFAAIRMALQSGIYTAEYRTRRNGEYLWASSWGEIVESGKLLLGVTADVTSIKEGERYRAERERLLATAEMSASLAHEINNPLTAITGALYMAKDTETGSGEVEHYLNIASAETRRIAEIVRRLLQLHRTTTVPSSFDVVKLWKELTESNADLKRSGTHVHIEAEGPAPVVGYVDELRHGFSNLLTYAVESSERGSVIRVRIRSAHSVRSGVRGVRLLLCAFGTMLQTVNVERLFEPFARAKSGQGTGLDLWVTRAAVLKQGGDVRVRSISKPQRITCIRVFLPNRSAE